MGVVIRAIPFSRPPRGGRGLKCFGSLYQVEEPESPPSRGAWIEIIRHRRNRESRGKSPPSRGAWIEIFVLKDFI